MNPPVYPDPIEILNHFYREEKELLALLLKHSEQVKEKALQILKSSGLQLDTQLVSTGAMLHDTGILRCHAPGILCHGKLPYIAHGITGAEMLRKYAETCGMDLEPFARICERHTGSGLTAEEIRHSGLPLPEQDLLPETPEEKLICLADKFFSKSGDMAEKNFTAVRRSMEKFGPEPLVRFDALCREFKLDIP